MTLTEFLLARIDQERADAHDLHHAWCDKFVPPGFPCDCGYPDFVLAECKAKRRIVETRSAAMEAAYAIEATHGEWEYLTGEEFHIIRAEFRAQNRVLRLLASVYADHPDYREEWRV